MQPCTPSTELDLRPVDLEAAGQRPRRGLRGGAYGGVAWQMPHPAPEPTGGVAAKSAPKGLSVRMAEWHVRQPAPACGALWLGAPSLLGWLATVFTCESAWQRRQLAGLVMSMGALAFWLVWMVRMATPLTGSG